GSDLERRWLLYLERNGHCLPASAQEAIPSCRTRPDFLYEGKVAVYIDGPVHQYLERQQRDVAQTEAMEDRGFTVVRFADEATWEAVIARYPSVFGIRSEQVATTGEAGSGHTLDNAQVEGMLRDAEAWVAARRAEGWTQADFVRELGRFLCITEGE